MKGEYGEQQHHPKSETPNSIFSKLQHHHNPFPHHHHPFQQQLSQDQCQQQATPTADDDVSASASHHKPNSSAGDGASIEVVRRPRGRPPGSKNKPKPPVVITREPEPTMSPYILEVSGGNDVVEAIARFSRRRNMGLCVLTGSGTVANVTLRQPSATPGATVTFHGRFDILSVSATVIPHPQGASPAVPSGFAISLAGPQGQIIGGLVAGGLMAAGTVYVIAASFSNPSYHRLPPAEEEEARNSISGGGGERQSSPASGGGGGVESGHAESCGMAMYSSHMASDVIWTPMARPPPPPPPY